MKLRWDKKNAVYIAHGAVWLLLFLLPYLLRPSFERASSKTVHPTQPSVAFNLMKLGFWMAFFYFNAYVLLPQLFYKGKRLYYAISLLLVMVSLSVVDFGYFAVARSAAHFRMDAFLLFNFFPFLFFVACSFTYQSYLHRREEEKRNKERETETLKTELSFLRSQMSPHFMFNVLNNMVSLARKKSDLLEPSLIKFSSLMRYFLYENDEEKVSLEKEIGYLQSYIDLQQQRFGKNLSLQVCMSQDKDYDLEPMLLIPFVENAFKHGVGLIADPEIKVRLEAKNGRLLFEVSNKFDGTSAEEKDKTAGIGLANVQRRLDLLYRKNHTLQIEKNGGCFTVVLHLNFT